jgi:hypothetical protein
MKINCNFAQSLLRLIVFSFFWLVVSNDSFAHRVQDYERWPLEKLCKQVLDSNGSISYRELYIKTLGEKFRADPKTTSTLISIIGNRKEDQWLREVACETIDLVGPNRKHTIAFLISGIRLNDKSFPVLGALRALAKNCSGNEQVIELLFQISKDKSNSSILRRNAVYFTGNYLHKNQGALKLLTDFAAQREEDPHVRYNAAATLAKNYNKNKEVMLLLRSLAQDKSEDLFVRRSIVRCLGRHVPYNQSIGDFVYQIAIDESNPQHLRDVATVTLTIDYKVDNRGLPLATQMAQDINRTQVPRLRILSYLKQKYPFNYTRKYIPLYQGIAQNPKEDETVRVCAISGLRYNEKHRHIFLGIKKLALDKNDASAVRIAALGRISKNYFHNEVISMMSHIAMDPEDDINVRLKSMSFLAYSTELNPSAAKLFRSLIENNVEDAMIRKRAAFHIATRFSKHTDIAQFSKWAQNNSNEGVRRAAMMGLSIKLKLEGDLRRLLIQDTVSPRIHIDATIPITRERVSYVADKLNSSEEKVRSQYKKLAELTPLKLEFIQEQ